MNGQSAARAVQRSSGAVLIVALVLLLVLTVLGTAGIQDTTLEERIAGNFRDADVALQAAETALRAGETYLIANLSSLTFSAALDGGGLYDIGAGSIGKAVDPRVDANYGSSAFFQVTTGLTPQVSQSAEFFIEKLPSAVFESDLGTGVGTQVLELDFYRITGRGFGISPNSEVILQSTFLPSF